MQSQYALLFSVALYKEISFLDRKAAESLITQPAGGLHTYDQLAIDRIIEVTSGHAYFVQLLCHSLFARWQRDNKPQITAEDVESVESEVVERGSANLKFEWDESLPVERLFLSAMAEAMDGSAGLTTPQDVDEVLRRYDILVPQGELVSAHRSFIGKELVVGNEEIRFAIDFLRLWVRQHERMEWVKEELSTEVEELREVAEAEIEAAESRQRRKRFRWGAVLSTVALVVILLLFIPGSPLRVFSASTVVEEVKVAAAIPFELGDKCGTQRQAPGVDLFMCRGSVERLTDSTTRVNVHWTVTITSGESNASLRAKSEVGDTEPFLLDAEGNRYEFIGAEGAATQQLPVIQG